MNVIEGQEGGNEACAWTEREVETEEKRAETEGQRGFVGGGVD